MVAVTRNPLDVVNTVTGEVTRATPYVGSRAYRDISEFVKVYDWGALMKLKVYEFKVLCYALDKLDFEGKFLFSADECMIATGLGRRSVFDGLKGLMDLDYIKKEKKGMYWFNPNIAFRGSRDGLLWQLVK